MFFEPVTKYFINRYFDLGLVGVYDICNRAATQVRNGLNSGIQVLTPRVTQLYELNTLDIKQMFLRVFRLVLILSSLCFVVLLFGLTFILQIFANTNHNVFIFFSVSLSFAYLFNTISIVPYSILLGLGELKIIVYSHIFSTVINVAFFIFFKNFENSYFIILPPFFAVLLSSIYLMTHFMLRFNIQFSETFQNLKLFIFLLLTFISTISFQIIINNLIMNILVFLSFTFLILAVMKNVYVFEFKQYVFKKFNK